MNRKRLIFFSKRIWLVKDWILSVKPVTLIRKNRYCTTAWYDTLFTFQIWPYSNKIRQMNWKRLNLNWKVWKVEFSIKPVTLIENRYYHDTRFQSKFNHSQIKFNKWIERGWIWFVKYRNRNIIANRYCSKARYDTRFTLRIRPFKNRIQFSSNQI